MISWNYKNSNDLLSLELKFIVIMYGGGGGTCYPIVS